MTDIGTVPERLARNRYELDEAGSHIELVPSAPPQVEELLIRICPAHVYSRATDGSLVVQHAACLECGACLAVAGAATLRWHYPGGGFGVAYREG